MRGMGTSVEYKEVNWTTLLRLAPYLGHYKSRLLLALLFLVAAKIASLTLPFVLKHVVDDLDTPNELLTIPLALLIAYGLVRFSNVLFSELRDTVFGRVTEHAMHDIALRVFKHLHALDLQFHLNRKTGGLARDIERGTTGISFLLRFMVFNIIPTLIEIVAVIAILSGKYSPYFGLIVFSAIVFYIAWSVWATELRTRFVKEMNQADSNTNSRAIDSLLNYETVKYFGNEQYEADRYDENLSDWESARRKNRLSIFLLNAGQALIISFFMTTAMILAANEVSSGAMTLGDFVLINTFMMQIFMPLNFLGFVYREMKGSLANIGNMFDLLDEPVRIFDSESADQRNKDYSSIEIKNIVFSYEGSRNLFNNLSLSIPVNKKTAIVGGSGSGKSTLLKLLFRFYEVESGAIFFGNQNIKDITLQSLRASMAFVPQDTVLFNASIFENIRYGNIEASKDDVLRCVKMAHLEDFVNQLPKGLETVVGERGLKLSGGEKQRVAIARALLKNPQIMVYDEATSSLDSDSEKQILEAINEISEFKTSLVVAHRLSTIIDSDLIIVLENGEKVEQGTHEELLVRNGRYADLWKLQERNLA